MATEEQNLYDIQDPAEGGEEVLNEVMEEQGITTEGGEQAPEGDNGADEPSGAETEEPSEVVDDDAHDEVEQGNEQELPTALVREAEQLGFSQEDIQSFGDAPSLERALVVFNRQLAARGRPDEQGTQEPEQRESPKEAPKLELPEINLEEVDPEIAKYIEAQSKIIQDMHSQVHGLSGLQEQVQALYAQEEQRQIDAFNQQFNGFIDGLGESWDDVFGKKAGDPDKARTDLINEASVLAAGYEATGREMPTSEDLLNRALRSLHGDRFQNLARKELNGKLKQRARQGIARPSNRKAADMTPEERATRAVAEQMASKGLTGDGFDEQPTF